MSQLARGTDIRLGDNTYKLARREALIEAGFPASTRTWSRELVPIATTIEPRPDVRPGEIPGEYVIIWNDWSKGITSLTENLPGCHYINRNIIPYQEGKLVGTGPVRNTNDNTNLWGAHPCTWVEFNNIMFLVAGRYCFKFQDATLATDVDFGASIFATDAKVHNNELVVGFGGSTNKIRTRNTAGGWTTATDATYANYFSPVEDRLWRATNANEVSNIGPTDNPLTLANWSSAITVGDDDVTITDLNASGEKLVVSKEDGLYMGDAAAIFPNVAPLPRDPDNGTNTLSNGASIFYPHRYGLKHYNGISVEEIGIDHIYNEFNSGDYVSGASPGTQFSALAFDGVYLWTATRPSYQRMLDGWLQKTINSGTSYTNYSTEVGDNNAATYADLGALDLLANGDYFIVSANEESVWYGFFLKVKFANTTASNMVVHYWNGTTWASFATNNWVQDGTTLVISGSSTTLARSGWVVWQEAPADWAKSTINGVVGRWVRVSFDVALSATVQISEVRTSMDTPRAYIFRGRPRQSDDLRNKSVIWDCVFNRTQTCESPYISALAISRLWPYGLAKSILGASRQHVIEIQLSEGLSGKAMEGAQGEAIFPLHDGGFPNVNKQFIDFTIQGRYWDANHVVGLYHRQDEMTSFRAGNVSITGSPTIVALMAGFTTGYFIQPRILISTFSHDDATEILGLECRFRPLFNTKAVYKYLLIVGDGQVGSRGQVLPSGSIQTTNLRALMNTRITQIDPLNTSTAVEVIEVREEEALQDERGYPAKLFAITTIEE